MECDATWGEPTQIKKSKKGYRCIYKYKKYEINIYFSEAGSIYDMTLFFKSRKSALKTYKSGNFVMRGSQIVKYIGNDENVTFPTNVVAIECGTFKNNASNLKIKIPNGIDLHMGAFNGINCAEITFEEGRTEITRAAFSGMTDYGNEDEWRIKITLPNSIRIIKEAAFCNRVGGEKIKLILNEGLEEIGKYGVCGLYLDFPDSLKILGEGAIHLSMYNGY